METPLYLGLIVKVETLLVNARRLTIKQKDTDYLFATFYATACHYPSTGVTLSKAGRDILTVT